MGDGRLREQAHQSAISIAGADVEAGDRERRGFARRLSGSCDTFAPSILAVSDRGAMAHQAAALSPSKAKRPGAVRSPRWRGSGLPCLRVAWPSIAGGASRVHMHQQPELAPRSGPNRSSKACHSAGVSGRIAKAEAPSVLFGGGARNGAGPSRASGAHRLGLMDLAAESHDCSTHTQTRFGSNSSIR